MMQKQLNDEDLLCKSMSSKTSGIEVAKIPPAERDKAKADVALAFADSAKTKTAILLFKVVNVSKSILETKWANGSKNYAVQIETIDSLSPSNMRWFAFKDYSSSSKNGSWQFVHESVVKSWSSTFEILQKQSVALVPLSFVEECSMSFEDLFDHYKKAIEEA